MTDPLPFNAPFSFWPGIADGFLIVMTFVLLCIGLWSQQGRHVRSQGYGALGILAVTFGLLWGTDGDQHVMMNGMFLSNLYVLYGKKLLVLLVMLYVFMTVRSMERDNLKHMEYPVLILLSTAGMLLILSANDLMVLFIGLEMMGLSLYVLAAADRASVLAAESGMKYFILGGLGTAFFLYGSSFLYGYGGTVNLDTLARVLPDAQGSMAVLVGVVLVVAAFALKLSLAPFHVWTPDVYQGSPTSVTAFLAAAPKVAIFAFVLRFFPQIFGSFADALTTAILALSCLSMGWGAIAALSQTSIKRILAYSAISHMGYGFLSLLSVTEKAQGAGLLYITLYAIMTVGVFACLLNIRRGGRLLDHVDDLDGLGTTHPWTAGCLTLFLFSLAGVPPLAGFFAKLAVFQTAVEAGFLGVAVFGVITSVISAAYYLNLIKGMYFRPSPKLGAAFVDKWSCRETSFVMLLCGGMIVFYLIVPGVFLGPIGAAVSALQMGGATPLAGAAF